MGFCVEFDGLAPGMRLVHVGLVLRLMIRECACMDTLPKKSLTYKEKQSSPNQNDAVSHEEIVLYQSVSLPGCRNARMLLELERF